MKMDEQAPSPGDDEIDLRELGVMLVEGWRWLVGSLVAALVAATAYLFVTTAMFSTEVSYTLAADGLRALNNMPDTSYSSVQVADELTQRLGAYTHFSRFVEADDQAANLLAPLLTDADGDPVEDRDARLNGFFTSRISLRVPDPEESGEGGIRRLQIAFSEALPGADLINRYYQWALDDYRRVLVERAEDAKAVAIARNESEMQAHLDAYDEQISNRITRMTEKDQIRLATLRDQLAAEKQAIVAARQERIRALREAELIAADLGITRPTTPRDFGRQSSDREIIYAEINAQDGLPLYFMGTEALRAEREVIEQNLDDERKTAEIRSLEKEIELLEHNREIEALRSREAGSPFIDAYSELRQENALIRANSVSPEQIEVAEVVSWAYPPNSPDSPNTRLILVAAIMLGGMFGLLLVFVSRFAASVKSYRARQRQDG